MEKARQGRGKRSWEQEVAVFILERLSGSQGPKKVTEQTVCLSGATAFPAQAMLSVQP